MVTHVFGRKIQRVCARWSSRSPTVGWRDLAPLERGVRLCGESLNAGVVAAVSCVGGAWLSASPDLPCRIDRGSISASVWDRPKFWSWGFSLWGGGPEYALDILAYPLCICLPPKLFVGLGSLAFSARLGLAPWLVCCGRAALAALLVFLGLFELPRPSMCYKPIRVYS